MNKVLLFSGIVPCSVEEQRRQSEEMVNNGAVRLDSTKVIRLGGGGIICMRKQTNVWKNSYIESPAVLINNRFVFEKKLLFLKTNLSF